MKRGGHLTVTAIILAALAGLLAATASATHDPRAAVCLRSTAERVNACGFPSLKAALGIAIEPRKLPRHDLTPVAFYLWGKFAVTDTTHPSALREMTIDVDRNVVIDTKGLPVCHQIGPRLHPREGVQARCKDATVGAGKVDFEIAFPERPRILERSPVTVYNAGSRNGVTTLYAVASIDVPAPRNIVTPIRITRVGKGRYGYEAIANPPVIAGGSGSLIDFRLRIARHFRYKRQRKSFVAARCPTGKLQFALPKLRFRNEAHEPGISPQTILKGRITTPCTPAAAPLPTS